jgi:cyclophilin family peptidyl-prolyl cis-trans isomerase
MQTYRMGCENALVFTIFDPHTHHCKHTTIMTLPLLKRFALACSLILLNLPVVSAAKKQDVELLTQRGTIVLRLSDETPKHRDNFIRLVNLHQLDSLNFYRIIQTFLIQTGKDLPTEFPALIDAEFRPDLFHKRGALNAAREGDEYNPTQASAALHFTIITGKLFNDSTLDKAEKRINHGIAYNKVIRNPANAALFANLQAHLQAGTNPIELKTIQTELEDITQKELSTMALYRIPEAHRKVYKTIGGAPHLDQNYTVFGEVVKGMDIVDSIAGVKTGENDKPLKDILILKAKMIKRIK